MRIVVALGGNALLRRGDQASAATQRLNVRRACVSLARVAAGNELIVTHGNGPQVGLLALERAGGDVTGADPLDVLDAETEGMIGYLIQQEMDNALPRGRLCVTMLTQVEVAADDPAFAQPGKPIGPRYPPALARELAARHGWSLLADGPELRRAVASPRPRRIVEIDVIRRAMLDGVVVVCAGGGGIPVLRDAAGGLDGVEAVIDKDHTSALLARELAADALLLLTDVDALRERWPEQPARRFREVGAASLAGYQFAAGSMAPKVAAACEFVSATGALAAIGALDQAADLLAGTAGTRILPGDLQATWWP